MIIKSLNISNLPKVKQLVSGRTAFQFPEVWLLSQRPLKAIKPEKQKQKLDYALIPFSFWATFPWRWLQSNSRLSCHQYGCCFVPLHEPCLLTFTHFMPRMQYPALLLILLRKTYPLLSSTQNQSCPLFTTSLVKAVACFVLYIKTSWNSEQKG